MTKNRYYVYSYDGNVSKDDNVWGKGKVRFAITHYFDIKSRLFSITNGQHPNIYATSVKSLVNFLSCVCGKDSTIHFIKGGNVDISRNGFAFSHPIWLCHPEENARADAAILNMVKKLTKDLASYNA